MGEKGSAILVLEDGTVFKGKAIGKIGTTGGEIAFNTGMTGYQEVFTDPSYYGQLLIMTTAHIGNYGTQSNEQESDKINISGLITKKFSDGFSRTSGDQSLQDFMVHHETVGISDIDTRALVRHIRDKGAMNAIISSSNLNEENLKKDVLELPKMNGLELSSKVTTADAYEVLPDNVQFKVSLLDLGVKRNIVQCLVERGCHVKVFPLHSSKEDLTSFNPDGYMLSNGPGDPSAMPETITLVKEIIATGKPVFGICLGHQILSLALNGKTFKLPFGHHGGNQPVMDNPTGKVEITSQNHGFVVSRDEAESRQDLTVTHIHLNDNTLAGIKLNTQPAFSVQFHPESSAGPNDSRYLFDEFVALIDKHVSQPA